jgi:hypothetical protein
VHAYHAAAPESGWYAAELKERLQRLGSRVSRLEIPRGRKQQRRVRQLIGEIKELAAGIQELAAEGEGRIELGDHKDPRQAVAAVLKKVSKALRVNHPRFALRRARAAGAVQELYDKIRPSSGLDIPARGGRGRRRPAHRSPNRRECFHFM